MSSSSNAVKMNYGESLMSVAIELGPYHPHPSILIRLVTRNKPLNKGAWIAFPIGHEREKKLNTSDHHALHTVKTTVYRM